MISPCEGTIFHNSRTKLRTWFFAMFLMTASKNGVSEKRLREIAGSHGFEHLHEITPLSYPRVIDEIELIGTQA